MTTIHNYDDLKQYEKRQAVILDDYGDAWQFWPSCAYEGRWELVNLGPDDALLHAASPYTLIYEGEDN